MAPSPAPERAPAPTEQPPPAPRPPMTHVADQPAHAPQAAGNAPWQRAGAALAPPADPAARAKADKWNRHNRADAHAREQRRVQRAAERQKRKEEEERLRAEQLENNARRMYIAGFFALPLVWLVALIYFREEHKDENGNQRIKQYYRRARFWLVVYTVLFVAWFIAFQVKADTFSSINIVNFTGTSPSGV